MTLWYQKTRLGVKLPFFFLCTFWLVMVCLPASASDSFEREPGDQDRYDGFFYDQVSPSQEVELEPDDIEKEGDFVSGRGEGHEEIEPADQDRGGDFGDPFSQRRRSMGNTIQLP